jgi:hypothetical protein
MQRRVLKIVQFWLEDRAQDFVADDHVSGAFVEFLSKKGYNFDSELASSLAGKLEQKVRTDFFSNSSLRSSSGLMLISGDSFHPITQNQAHWRRVKKHMANSPSRDGSAVNRDFLSFKPTAIANELTMIFSELYQRIEPMEFLTHGKSKPGDKVRHPPLRLPPSCPGWIFTDLFIVVSVNVAIENQPNDSAIQ